MKNIVDFLNECLVNEAKITDKDSFMEAARKKFKEVFKDELDESKMNETIDGLLKDNKELVDNGDWGSLIGLLNKSFAN